MIKIIFVLDKLPFKPSNGVTIASNSLIRASFSICDEIDVFIIGENKIYKDIREDFSYGFSELNHNVNYSEYCTVFVSPISTFLRIKNNLSDVKKLNLVVQLSDCVVYELWISFLLSLKFKRLNIKPLLKIPYYYFIEFKVNWYSSKVILQTRRDVKIFNSLYLKKNGINLPNLIRYEVYKEKKITNSIGWCATFDGDYLVLAKWFSEKVIFPFLSSNPNIKLSVIGAKNDLFCSYLKSTYPIISEQIEFNDYIKNISDFYKKNRVTISPVFKGYGLINKTIESMSSGNIVLGDITTFNGIDNVSNLINCLVAESPVEFIESLELVFNVLSDEELLKIGKNAHDLILSQFKKADNIYKLKEIINK